ncbi:MAG: hypothetical protein E6767_18520 [Dysgonomonas sp.]|nr:hypothetical protein [Dysgonomonas sp.]
MKANSYSYPIYNYEDIFRKYFFLSKTSCHRTCPDYVLIFVFSGKLTIRKRKENITVEEGEYIFLRKDIEIILIRESSNNKAFKSIFMGLNHSFLREFYRNIDKENIPHNTRSFRKNIIKLPQNPYLESLYISMRPYMQWCTKPIKQILKIRLIEAVFSLLSINGSFYPYLFDIVSSHKSYRLRVTNENSFSNLQQCIMSKEIKVTYIEIQQEAEITDIYMDASCRDISWFIREFKYCCDLAQLH